MKKDIDGTMPSKKQIEKAIDRMKNTDHMSYANFADNFSRYIEITMKKDKISRLQGVALTIIVMQGGNITPSQLAGLMFRSKYSLTRIIDSLEKEGFVKRDQMIMDRRTTLIKITSTGLEYIMMSLKKADKRTHEIMNCLDSSERKLLVKLTDRMSMKIAELINNF